MPNRKKVERSANYSYYSDLLWCTVPLIGMSWYYYGARPVLLLLAALLTAYLCDCALAPLHGTGYQSHEPSSECAAMGTSAALVVMACGLFLLVRGHIKLSVVIPFFIFVIGLPWFFPNLNELPTFSLPWEYIRQRFYLEKYVVLSGTALFTGLFLICEPVTMPDRRMSRIIYGAALGIMTYVFRVFSPYECAACCALLIVSSIPEWLDLISHRTERIRFMREEEQRLANSTKPE